MSYDSSTIWRVKVNSIHPYEWHFKRANGLEGIAPTRSKARELRALSFKEVKPELEDDVEAGV